MGVAANNRSQTAVQLRGRASIQVRSNFAYHFPHVSRTSSLLHCPDSDKWPRRQETSSHQVEPRRSRTRASWGWSHYATGVKRHSRLFRQEAVPGRVVRSQDGAEPKLAMPPLSKHKAKYQIRSNFSKPELIEIEDGQVEKVRKIVLVIYRAESHEEFPTVTPIIIRQARCWLQRF